MLCNIICVFSYKQLYLSIPFNLTADFSGCSISDDDEVPPLTSKFGDIYAMSSYEDNSVGTAAVNGLHNNINGEGENMALKARVSYLLKKIAQD